jgi:hypothetical protein
LDPAIVEAPQRLVQRDELTGLRPRQAHLGGRPVVLVGVGPERAGIRRGSTEVGIDGLTVRRGGHPEHLLVGPVDRWVPAHHEPVQTVGSDGELEADHRQPRIAVVREPRHVGGIRDREDVGHDGVGGERVGSGGLEEVSLVAEGDEGHHVAEADDQGAAECGVGAPSPHLVRLRPFHGNGVDGEEQRGAAALHVDVDRAAVRQRRRRHRLASSPPRSPT